MSKPERDKSEHSPRYRRTSTQMWRDEKFMALSKPKPNAQTLFHWLFTGPLTTSVPGYLSVSVGAIAGELEWSVPATDKVIIELETARMLRVDRAARFMWLPNSVKHNEPANPNICRGWARTLISEYPECPLMREAIMSLRAYLGALGGDFLKAFDGSMLNGLRKRSWNGFGSCSMNHPLDGLSNGIPNAPPAVPGIRIRDQESGSGSKNKQKEAPAANGSAPPAPSPERLDEATRSAAVAEAKKIYDPDRGLTLFGDVASTLVEHREPSSDETTERKTRAPYASAMCRRPCGRRNRLRLELIFGQGVLFSDDAIDDLR